MDFNELKTVLAWPWKSGQKTETLHRIATHSFPAFFITAASFLSSYHRHINDAEGSVRSSLYNTTVIVKNLQLTSLMAIFLVNIQKTMERSTIFKFGKSVNQLNFYGPSIPSSQTVSQLVITRGQISLVKSSGYGSKLGTPKLWMVFLLN